MCAAKRLSVNERKDEIMKSAIKVIIEKGLENTTMEDIISGTTLSKGGVYHHYGSVIDIFKDIMLFGISYRMKIIEKELNDNEGKKDRIFVAKQIVDKIVDDNAYMPLYVEFLRCQNRNEELRNLMVELKEENKIQLKQVLGCESEYLFDNDTYDFLTDFMNAMIMAAEILDARGNFKKNRLTMERMVLLILGMGKEKMDEDL